jgi:hypothetical protein
MTGFLVQGGSPPNQSVTTATIVDDAVTTAKIADVNVTTAKIADVNVTTAKIANEGVTLAKMATLADSTLIVGDGSGAPVAESGATLRTSIGVGTTDTVQFKTVLATTDTDTSNTGSVTLDFAANQNFILTFTGNVTLANPSTEAVGQAGVIVCIQDGTGGRTLGVGTDYETAGGATSLTLSTAANAVDILPYFVKASGSILLGAPQLAFS